MRILLLVLTLLFSYCCLAQGRETVDFDKSMGINFFKKVYNYTLGKNHFKAIKKIKSNYYKHINNEGSELNKIPRIIHIINLENEPLSENSKYFINTCKRNNPSYEFKIWDADNLINLPLEEQNLLKSITNSQDKKELLSYLVLYKYGGVYIGNNVECINTFDKLLSRYDIFTSIASESYNFRFPSSIIGASPNNKLLENIITLAKSKTLSTKDTFEPSLSDIFLTQLIKSFDEKNNYMIFPASFFYPTYKTIPIFETIDEKIIVPTPTKETIAIDYFHGKSTIDFRNFNYELVGENFGKESLYSPYYENKKADQILEEIYNRNFPSLLDFSEEAIIPLDFNILCLDKCDRFWTDNINWFNINNIYSFHLWSTNDLEKIMADNVELFRKIKNEETKLWLSALLILQNNGGIYVNGKLSPIGKFDELNYKYTFFGAIPYLDDIQDDILLHMDVLGATPDNIIVNNTLNRLKKLDTINKRSFLEALTISTIENHKKAGNIIVFPGTYFYGNSKSNDNFKFTNYY
jgi:hypothetical protein